jgi:outer membrane biosynthesis protein TonB
MKVKVSNISSGLLALPAPLSVTLAAGRGALLSLSEPEWKAVCASPAIARLIQTRMLSMAAVQEAPPAPKPVVVVVEAPKPVVVEAPKPVVEEPKVEPVAPVEEPKAEEPAPEPKVAPVEEPKAEEPASEPAAPVEEPKKKKKKN